ncbi:MAG: translation elongation factor Ts [Acidobacteria bacterium]|nr:translation elongation factor Ts [Acidobacteriota bacterium]MBI3655554.1 translation elongation factor Ts [Acidobacteriota bacterium]
MAIPANLVRDLREETGAGIMECKVALEASSGDKERAKAWLREKGLAKAIKKASRATSEGLVGSYIHIGGKIGVLVEVNCETDFVARTDEFQSLVKDIAMQIAATDPMYLRGEDVPEDGVARQREAFRQEALSSGVPADRLDRVVDEKVAKFFAERCLYEQPFIKDPGTNIGQLVAGKIAKIGENIKVNRFARFKIGEPQTV